MKSEKTQRGFVVVDHPGYTDGIPVTGNVENGHERPIPS